MPWTTRDYPVSMKNLEVRVRNKAIEIANALLKEGYEVGRAIAIATATAEKWAENNNAADKVVIFQQLHVVPHPDGWAVRRANAERASFVFGSKAEAQKKATEMAHDGSVVVIHDENGQIERHITSA